MEIYESLRDKIDTGIYHEMMPSENTLVKSMESHAIQSVAH